MRPRRSNARGRRCVGIRRPSSSPMRRCSNTCWFATPMRRSSPNRRGHCAGSCWTRRTPTSVHAPRRWRCSSGASCTGSGSSRATCGSSPRRPRLEAGTNARRCTVSCATYRARRRRACVSSPARRVYRTCPRRRTRRRSTSKISGRCLPRRGFRVSSPAARRDGSAVCSSRHPTTWPRFPTSAACGVPKPRSTGFCG